MPKVNDLTSKQAVLSEAEITEIHRTSLAVLEDEGMKVGSRKLREILDQEGATVTDDRVKLPPDLVREAIDSCPSEVTLYSQNGKDLTLGQGRMFHSPGCHRLKMYDYDANGKFRKPTLSDVRKLTRLADSLDNIDAVTLMVSASEEPDPLADLLALGEMTLNSGKHYYLAPQNFLEAKTLLDLSEILTDDFEESPIASLFVSATSPLILAEEPANILIEGARRGAVIFSGSCASAGATSPATIAGTILQQNIETLFIIVAAQTLKHGTPVIYDSGSTIADLRTGSFTLGAVEYSLITDGARLLADKYNLPFSTTCDTDSPSIDVQNGLQKMLGYFTMMNTGVDFSKDAGSLNNGAVFSYEQMVIDDEIMGICSRYFEGIRFDSESLAEDLIRKVGPGGEYLTTNHTLSHCRDDEHFVSELLNMSQRDQPSTLERASEKAQELVSTHEYPLPEKQEREIKRYIKKLKEKN